MTHVDETLKRAKRVMDTLYEIAEEFKFYMNDNTDSFIIANYWALKLIADMLVDNHIVLPDELSRLEAIGKRIKGVV